MLRVVESPFYYFMNKHKLKTKQKTKQQNPKKQYTPEIEGAMVKKGNCNLGLTASRILWSHFSQHQVSRISLPLSLCHCSSLCCRLQTNQGANMSAFWLSLCLHVQKVRRRSKANPVQGLLNQLAGKRHRRTFHTFTDWACVVGPPQCGLILQEGRRPRLQL